MNEKSIKMSISILWKYAKSDKDENMQFTRILYAYVHKNKKEILYIGKACGETSSARKRFYAPDKKLRANAKLNEKKHKRCDFYCRIYISRGKPIFNQ